MILTIQGTSDLFLDLELEVTETAAAGLPLRGSQMDATIRDSDGSGKCDLFLSFSPSVSYRQHPSEVHARAAYEAKNFIGWARLALTYPPKLQKRPYYASLHFMMKIPNSAPLRTLLSDWHTVALVERCETRKKNI